jgi:hypothetical protein
VLKAISPLDVAVPVPPTRIIAPPVEPPVVVFPADRIMFPPPTAPVPANKLKVGPPPTDAPTVNAIVPLEPLLVVPVLKISAPLTPAVPALELPTIIAPEDETKPAPPDRVTEPPKAVVL